MMWAALLYFLSIEGAQAFGPPSVQYNDDGIQKYQSEDYPEAFDSFAKALGRDPFNPTFHLNLGDSFLKNEEVPKAISEFEAVEKSPKATPEQKYRAMFNAGNAAIKAKDIPQALKYYQKALSYNPDSLETKTNIELALASPQGGGKGNDKDQKDNKDQNQDQNKNNQNQQNKDDKNKKDQDKKDQDKKDQDKKDQDKRNQDQKQNQDKNQQDKSPEPRPTPHGFKSQSLNEGDVRRILEELKRQEEEIRAKQYKERRDAPEREIEKDW